jgi:hypothetical protein
MSKAHDVSSPRISSSAIPTNSLLRDALTFRIWKIFQEAFPHSLDLDHIYCLRIEEGYGGGPREWDSIQRQITTLPFTNLTNLNVRSVILKHVHLMELTNFPNLAVLALEQFEAYADYHTGINEQFMKRWGVMVREKKAFMQLKVVVFRQFRISLEVTLTCFRKFPSLALCNTDQWDHSAVVGWRQLCIEEYVQAPLPCYVSLKCFIGEKARNTHKYSGRARRKLCTNEWRSFMSLPVL